MGFFLSLLSMFCGLILYDKDGGLLETFVHIKYYILWYFAVIKYAFEIDKGQQVWSNDAFYCQFLMQIESISNCYYFPVENIVSKIVC